MRVWKCVLVALVAGLAAPVMAVDFETIGTQNLSVPAGTYDNVFAYNDSTLGMGPGVTVDFEAHAYDNSTFNMTGGDVADDITAFDFSFFNFSDGNVGRDAEAFGSSTMTMSGGTVDRYAEAFDSSMFNITDGVVWWAYASNTAEMNVSGGSVSQNLESYLDSTVNFSAGTVLDEVIAFGNSEFNMSGGSVSNNALVTDNAVFNLSNGDVNANAASFTTSTFNMSGGVVDGDLEIQDSSVGNFSGGVVQGSVQSFNNSTLNMTGGTLGGFNPLDARGDSTINFSGGSTIDARAEDNSTFNMIDGGDILSNFAAFESADIYIYAKDFGPNHTAGQVLTLGDLGLDPFASNPNYNGTVLRLTFSDDTYEQFNFRAWNNGVDIWTGTLNLIAIPEPASLIMLGLGSVALLRRAS